MPIDKSQATRQHRIHQGVWRTNVAQWPAGQPQNDRRVRARYGTLPNWLAATHRGEDVRGAGADLMSPEARSYARDRLVVLERIDGKAEPDRLWRNLLSSQPLAFSVAGHLHRHRSAAATVFAGLTDLQIASLERLDPGPGLWTDHSLDGIDAEWFPPRTEHTNDLSGCDIACCLALEDGSRVLLTIEVKYTDTFSSAPVAWSRYEHQLTALGLDQAATIALVQAGCSQVLRQVMITDSVRRRGLTSDVGPSGRVDAGLAVVLARQDDKVARRVVQALDEAVGSRVPVRFWSHRHLLAEAGNVNELRGWADAMTARYLPAGV